MMKKIAILRCLLSNDVCTGAGCMRAFNKKTGSFAQYGDEDMELLAFWSCNGCGEVRMGNQAGLDEKIDRIVKMQPDAVHVGVCVKHENAEGEMVTCRNIVKICERLKEHGIAIVEGTH